MEQLDDATQTPAEPSSDHPELAPVTAPDAPDALSAADGRRAPDASPDLAAVRELILLAYPDLVPELVRGRTIAELQAAVAPARAAYRQVAERIAGEAAAGSPAVPIAPPAVPAGAAGGFPPTEGLPPGELIKRALQRRG